MQYTATDCIYSSLWVSSRTYPFPLYPINTVRSSPPYWAGLHPGPLWLWWCWPPHWPFVSFGPGTWGLLLFLSGIRSLFIGAIFLGVVSKYIWYFFCWIRGRTMRGLISLQTTLDFNALTSSFEHFSGVGESLCRLFFRISLFKTLETLCPRTLTDVTLNMLTLKTLTKDQ